METKVIPLSDKDALFTAIPFKIKQLVLDEDGWIQAHASGTLRKNKSVGFSYRTQYLQERIAYQFGYGFNILPRSKVTFGDPITEGDNHSVTEAGWHIERYINTRLLPEDHYEAKYITAEESDGPHEGIGIVVRETTAQWVPTGHIIYAIIAEFDKTAGTYKPATNPF
jgi:hypothetical protein